MGKTRRDPIVDTLSGRVGGIVFKRYGKRLIVCGRPNPTTKPPSAKQLLQRKRMKASGVFYRSILHDPALKQQYVAAAVAAEMSLRDFATQVYMRRVAAPDAGLYIKPEPLPPAPTASVAVAASTPPTASGPPQPDSPSPAAAPSAEPPLPRPYADLSAWGY